MRNIVTTTRKSRLTFVTGGLLVAGSAAILTHWAFAQSSTLTLTPANGSQTQAAAAPAGETDRYATEAKPAAPREEAPATQAATQVAAEVAAAPAVQAQLIEKPYPWNDSTRNVLSAWQQIAKERPDVHVTFDGPHAQARVHATAAVHAQLEQQLAQVHATAAQANAAIASTKPNTQTAIATNEAAGQPATASLNLRNFPAAELRPRLEKVLAQTINAGSDASGQWQLLNIETTPGNKITIAVNTSTSEVRLAGAAAQVSNWRTVVETLDSGRSADGTVTELVATKPRFEPYVRQALSNLQMSAAAVEGTAAVASMLFQAQPGVAPGLPAPITPPQPGQPTVIPGAESQAVQAGTPGGLNAVQAAADRGLLGPVQIQYLEGANLVIIRGREADVKRVLAIIDEIEKITQTSAPKIQVQQLQYVDSASMQSIVQYVYNTQFQARLGTVTVIALGKPNALMLIGPEATVDMVVKNIVAPLDQPVSPQSRFEVFHLNYLNATNAATTVNTFLGQGANGAPAAFQDLTAYGSQALVPRALVVAETTTNSLIVAASAQDIALVAELLRRLDAEPSVAASLKVFKIYNGDAGALQTTLSTLFGVGTTGIGGGVGNQGTTLGTTGLVPMQFSVDSRTNSILVVATPDQLRTVEAILVSLDSGDSRTRDVHVFRLKNAFAIPVANALSQWVGQENLVYTSSGQVISASEALRHQVVVIPEQTTNNLIVSTAPEYYPVIEKMIMQLDKQPPMVLMQVLIAEVRLTDTDEFGIELGLQDSLLFDRALLDTVQFQNVTSTLPNGTQTTSQQILSANGVPGYNFNNPGLGLGNNVGTASLAAASKVASQGISNFSVGRTNADLGFSGFVFSAQSNGVSALLRALQEKRRLEVLSRPQVMALDAQQAYLQVGQTIDKISQASIANGIQTNTTTQVNVGLILQLQPLISEDGKVVINVQAEKSEVGPESDGIPIQVSATGTVLRSPRIDVTRASSVVQAMDGQTIVLGGLLSTRKLDVHRRVPLISDIPLIGDLFRYDSVGEERRELLIIITPRVVKTPEDSERIKQIESSRMSWILNDVVALNGPSGLKSRCDDWSNAEVDTVFPNYVPQPGELCPTCQEGETIYQQGPMMQTPMLQPTPNGQPGSLPVPPTPPSRPMRTDTGSTQPGAAATGVSQAQYRADWGTVPAKSPATTTANSAATSTASRLPATATR